MWICQILVSSWEDIFDKILMNLLKSSADSNHCVVHSVTFSNEKFQQWQKTFGTLQAVKTYSSINNTQGDWWTEWTEWTEWRYDKQQKFLCGCWFILKQNHKCTKECKLHCLCVRFTGIMISLICDNSLTNYHCCLNEIIGNMKD